MSMSGLAIAATEAAVSTAVAIKGVVFIAGYSWNFQAPNFEPLWKTGRRSARSGKPTDE
jgi:hypothetical protein